MHVVRCFKDEKIIHVDGQYNLDPVEEMLQVQTELILADLEMCEKQMNKRGLEK